MRILDVNGTTGEVTTSDQELPKLNAFVNLMQALGSVTRPSLLTTSLGATLCLTRCYLLLQVSRGLKTGVDAGEEYLRDARKVWRPQP